MYAPLRENIRIEITLALLVGVLAVGAALAISLGQAILVLVAIGGIVAAIAVYLRPALGAALILAFAPLDDILIIRGQSVAKLATLLCLVVLIARHALNKKFEIDRTTLWGIALLGWSFISILWSPNVYHSISEWTAFVLIVGLYFLLINLVSSKEDFKLALWGHVLGGSVLAFISIRAAIGTEFARSEYVLGFGINIVSRIAGLTLLLSLLLYQLETNVLRKGILLLSAILTGIAVVITLSRGTWLGVSLSLAVLIAINLFRRNFGFSIRQLVIWSVSAVILIYMLNTFVLDQHGISKLTARFESGITLSDAAGGRFDIWKVAYKIILDSPIWGHGYESFKYYFTRYLDYSAEAKNAHNAYVMVITELGIIGVGILYGVLVSVFTKAWRFMFNKLAASSTVAPWGMVLFTFLIVATSVDSAVERKYFWYMLSLIVLLVRFWGQPEPHQAPANS